MKTSQGILALMTVFFLANSPLNAAQNKTVSPDLDWPAPQRENRPGCYWWWPGSAVDKENITWNLETMRRGGLGGGTIVPIYGVKGAENRFLPYLSPRWLEMLDHTVREADRLGMWVDMTTGTGWPFGGPEVSADDADARVVYREGKVSQKFSGRRVKRAAPGGAGYSINPYSQRALENYLKKFDRAFAASNSKLPRAQYHDSFEYAGNWCDDLFEEFKKRRGYDLSDHLVEFFEEKGDPDTIARLKSDYRETLSDLHLRYIETWVAWSARHGCTTRNQAHGAPGNLLDLYAAAGIPETEVFGANIFKIPGLRRDPDNVRSDFHLPMINRMAASAAHVAGRTLVASETCTWIRNHFRTALSQVKPEVDLLFLAGINHIFFHGCCYSPRDAAWPGWLFYASLEANPRNTIWHDIPALNQYITRCQSILQAGRPANDILLYWPVYDIWHNSRGLQQQLTVHRYQWLGQSPCGRIAQTLIDRGYTFDFVSDRQLRNTRFDRGKLIAPSGVPYRTILLPPTDHLPLETLRQLITLAADGATIILHGQIPLDVPGFGGLEQRRSKFKKLLAELTFQPPQVGNPDVRRADIGRGRFLLADDLEALLTAASVPREELADTGLGFIRRTHESGYHYFLANLTTGHPVDGWLPLALPLRSAVILDPLSGKSGLARLRKNRDRSEIYLQLRPGETRIIRTFTARTPQADPWPIYLTAGNPLELAGRWQVDFLEGGPQRPSSFNTTQLRTWTLLGDDQAKRFAGTARYRLEFNLPDRSADNWSLDLGDVRESARITLNGQKVGALFAFPYQIRVGPHLKKGKNLLEIEVTNLAANRIRDLDIRKVPWKIFHDINIVTHDYKKFDASVWPLTPSGLLGPVTLQPLSAKSLSGE